MSYESGVLMVSFNRWTLWRANSRIGIGVTVDVNASSERGAISLARTIASRLDKDLVSDE